MVYFGKNFPTQSPLVETAAAKPATLGKGIGGMAKAIAKAIAAGAHPTISPGDNS